MSLTKKNCSLIFGFRKHIIKPVHQYFPTTVYLRPNTNNLQGIVIRTAKLLPSYLYQQVFWELKSKPQPSYAYFWRNNFVQTNNLSGRRLFTSVYMAVTCLYVASLAVN